jgi:hypothetical protein
VFDKCELLRKNPGVPESGVLLAMGTYDAALAKAQPLPGWIYRLRRGRLHEAWKKFMTKTVGGNADQGAAYVFVRSGTGWVQQAELVASDGAADDLFGCSVSVSGDTVVIGALGRTVGGNADQGAAYAFLRSGASWAQQAELTASDGAASDHFGDSVSVSGDVTIIGAFTKTVNGHANQGAAYVFVRSGASWSQWTELTALYGAASDYFGDSVSVSGDTAVIGSPSKTVNGHAHQGAAYVFIWGAGSFEQAELAASDGAAGDHFGCSVSVSGDVAVIGASNKTISGRTSQGAAYVFVRSGASWSQQRRAAQEQRDAGCQRAVSDSPLAAQNAAAREAGGC